MSKTAARSDVPIRARKIWDLNSIRNFVDDLPEDWRPPEGEIHPAIIRYKGYWYCGFKEQDSGWKSNPGIRPRGGSRIIRSADGESWEPVKFITWEGGHPCNLRFSITAEGALMLHTQIRLIGVNQRYRFLNAPLRPECPGSGLANRMMVTWLTNDGLDWGTVNGCPSLLHSYLWNVNWYEGWGYGIAHGQKDKHGTLYRTCDGKSWQPLATHIFDSWTERAKALDPEELSPDDQRLKWTHSLDPNNENAAKIAHSLQPQAPILTALDFDSRDDTAVAVARTHPVFAILGTAPAPFYDRWTWRETQVDWNGDGELRPAGEKLGVQMGGPFLKYLSNGVLLAAGRADASTPTEPEGRLTLFTVDRERAILKRWGDFSGYSHYPDIFEHEGELWIACGRQQHDPFAVYLLRTPLPEKE